MTTDKQRERLLSILSDAPTEILLNAVEDFKAFKIRQSEALSAVLKYFGDGKPRQEASPLQAPVEGPSPKPEAVSLVKRIPLKHIAPPFEPAGKIGSEAEASAIGWLRNGPADVESLAIAMKRSTAQAGPLLARLVQKGKIKYRSDKLFEL